MESASDRSSRRGLCTRARRLRIIDQAPWHQRLEYVGATRVLRVHARSRGVELPGPERRRRDQSPRHANELACVPISPATVPQAPARRRPAWGDAREHEGQHGAPRGVHARPWRPRLSRPDHPQRRSPQDGTPAGDRYRRPSVRAGGKRMRRPMTSASRNVPSANCHDRRRSPQLAAPDPSKPSRGIQMTAGNPLRPTRRRLLSSSATNSGVTAAVALALYAPA